MSNGNERSAVGPPAHRKIAERRSAPDRPSGRKAREAWKLPLYPIGRFRRYFFKGFDKSNLAAYMNGVQISKYGRFRRQRLLWFSNILEVLSDGFDQDSIETRWRPSWRRSQAESKNA
jgi:hypothetical protein